MRLVSPLLKYAVYPALYRARCFDRIMPPEGFAVVNYHGVVPSDHSSSDPFLDGNLVHPEVLRRQLQFLKSHYQIVPPEDFRASIERRHPLPRRAILITCDDGLQNNLTDMLPVLRGESVPCLFFVTAASSGENPGMLWYDELYLLMKDRPLTTTALQLPPENGAASSAPQDFQSQWWSTVRRASRLDASARSQWMELVRAHCGPSQGFRLERRWRLLNISELRQLVASGGTIGAHTRSHPVLSDSTESEARREIQDSKAELEQALNCPVWAFAYPFGNPATMGEREVRLAREAGFACAFLNVERWPDQPSNPLMLPRVHVTSKMTLPEFAAHVSGFHARLQQAVGK